MRYSMTIAAALATTPAFAHHEAEVAAQFPTTAVAVGVLVVEALCFVVL